MKSKGLEQKPEQELEVIQTDIVSLPEEERPFDIEEYKKAIANWELMRDATLKMIKASDVIDMSGNPYLEAKTCELLANPLQIQIKQWAKPEKIFLEDGHYRWVYRGLAYFGWTKRAMWVEGVASSKDKFFAKAHGEWKEVRDIDETNIMAKARRNVIREAVTCLAGLRVLTWDDLKRVGIDQEKTLKVEFKADSDKRKAIANMIFEMSDKDKDRARGMLMAFSSFEKNGKMIEGKEDVKALSTKQVDVIYGKVKREYEDFIKPEE